MNPSLEIIAYYQAELIPTVGMFLGLTLGTSFFTWAIAQAYQLFFSVGRLG